MLPHETQQYWLPGYGLSRAIVLGQIQYFLGPAATARPYSYQGRDGYLITGVPLTRDQIDDLAAMSREYERQESLRMAGESTGGGYRYSSSSSYGSSSSCCSGTSGSSSSSSSSSSGASPTARCSGNREGEEPYINEIVWMRGAGYTDSHGHGHGHGHGEMGGRRRMRGPGASRRRVN